MVSRLLTEQQEREVAQLFEQGWSVNRLAKKYGCSPLTPRNVLIRRGVWVPRFAGMKERAKDKEITEQYRSGVSVADLARSFRRTCGSVYALLRRNGLNPGYKRKISPEQEREIVSLYRSGSTSPQLAQMFGVSQVMVRNYLRMHGVLRRISTEANRRIALNQCAFQTDSPERNYWLGFLMADGGLVQSGGSWQVVLSLAIRDVGHLMAFRRFVGSAHAVSTVYPTDSSPAVRLAFNSRIMGEDLIRFGIIPNKSHSAQVLGLNGDKDFFRGLIDGDGSIGLHKNGNADRPRKASVQLVGSRPLMEQFAAFVRTATLIAASVHRSKTIWAFSVTGGSAMLLLQHLYGDPAAPALARKMRRAQFILHNCDPANGLLLPGANVDSYL